MAHQEHASILQEDLVRQILAREEELIDYYHAVLGSVGDDARNILANIRRRHCECIVELRRYQDELAAQRELTGAIAD
jgi:hypothetical protein